jgi:chromosome segregation ATPase
VADSDNDIENRVGILEREVARLREQAALTSSDANAARVLAAGADHDVSEVRSELRAHTRALNALRETQLEQGRMLVEQGRMLVEQGQMLAEHGEGITSIRQELAEHGEGITSIRQELAEHGRAIVSLDQKMSAGFATLHTGMAKIAALLQNAGSEQG